MQYIPNVTQGIEGDDIPYHLSLLGLDINDLPNDVYFYPLVDHYNTHKVVWELTSNHMAAKSRTVVFYDLVNTSDFDHQRYSQFVSNFDHPNRVYLTVNQNPNFKIDGVKIISWDFMWNRFKAYYTESIPETLNLHHYKYQGYTLPKLDFLNTRSKLFMSLLGREYGWRQKLYNYVKDLDGYISNRSQARYIEPERVVGAFSPVPNHFYLDSYISIYVESNCVDTRLIHLTEKTFDPLVKGHIILPFANPGSIQRIKDLGFQLPPFVDYSYDSIEDTQERFNHLICEFNRLLTLDIPNLYNDYQDIFIYNQRCVSFIPYDDRIKEIFNV
jgi:hypothetical protein